MDDRAALRRVAEYIVAAEERGARCSTRTAILRTCGRAAGNSPGAVLWRLQRKWRSDGAALLAEVKEREAMRRRVGSAPVRGGLLGGGLGALMAAALRENDLLRTARAIEEAMIGPARALEEAMSVTRRFEDEVRRMALHESEIMRAHRTLEQLTRRW
jgi:hypothetical protein